MRKETLTLTSVLLIAALYFVGMQPGSRTFNLFNRGPIYSTDFLKTDTYLDVGSVGTGIDTFSTTDSVDTVLISDVTTASAFVLTGKTASPDSGEVLTFTTAAGTLFVHRNQSVTSGLTYSWLRVE